MANERLRAAMLTADLSVDALASIVGVDARTVERWVTLGRVPTRAHRWKTASRLGRDETYLWPSLGVGDSTDGAGAPELIGIYPSRASVPIAVWREQFERCNTAFEMLVYAGQFLQDVHPEVAEIVSTKARHGMSVRLLLGKPDGVAVLRRGDEEGIGADLAARVRLSLASLRPVLSVPEVEVRLHDTTLYCSTYRFDEDLFVNTHVYGVPAARSPVLHLRQVSGGGIVGKYLAGFQRIWESAEPVSQRSGE